MNHPALPLYPGFAHHQIDVAPGLHISAMVGGQGPGLLLLHGHPQTLAIWHKVAPTLAQHFTVVAADLRGYGDSSKPKGGPDHAAYAKRSMAQDQLRLMQQLGKNPQAASPTAPCFEIALCTPDVAAALERAIAAGATPMRPLEVMPWGQTIAYVADINGFLVELCTPMG